jgi:hypothetical protein
VLGSHSKHVLLSLAGVTRQEDRSEHVVASVLSYQTICPQWPWASAALVDLKLRHMDARVSLGELARYAPVNERLEHRQEVVRGDGRFSPLVAKLKDVLWPEAADMELISR